MRPTRHSPDFVDEHAAYLVYRFVADQVVRGVVDLSIADHLAEGGLTASEIAARAGADRETTLMLLKASVAAGLMTLDSRGEFHGTKLLAVLRNKGLSQDRALAVVTAGVVRHVILSERARRIAWN